MDAQREVHRRPDDAAREVAVGNGCADLAERVTKARHDSQGGIGQGAVEVEDHQLSAHPSIVRRTHVLSSCGKGDAVSVRLGDVIEVLDAAYPPGSPRTGIPSAWSAAIRPSPSSR